MPLTLEQQALRKAEIQEITEIWTLALAQAAFYVESHCANGEHHADTIMGMPLPKITVAGLGSPAPFAYVTADRKMLIFADNTAGITDDPDTLTPLFLGSPAVSAQAGWKLMPPEATPEMVRAAHECLPPVSKKWHAVIKEKYAAMFAAAPAVGSPAVQVEQDRPAADCGPNPVMWTKGDEARLDDALAEIWPSAQRVIGRVIPPSRAEPASQRDAGLADIVRRLLSDHQRISPHHASLCGLCRDAEAAIRQAKPDAVPQPPRDSFPHSPASKIALCAETPMHKNDTLPSE